MQENPTIEHESIVKPKVNSHKPITKMNIKRPKSALEFDKKPGQVFLKHDTASLLNLIDQQKQKSEEKKKAGETQNTPKKSTIFKATRAPDFANDPY